MLRYVFNACKILFVGFAILTLFSTRASAVGDLWTTSYGGLDNDGAESVQQTSDKGFIVAGQTRSFGAGGSDIWVLRLDANGDVIWQKSYGGSAPDYATSVQQTSDGGFIVSGQTRSFGAGRFDFWVLRLDANGDVIWQKTYGGLYSDTAWSVQQTSDGGFIVGGFTSSSPFTTGYDIWVLKLDANGDVIWQKSYGGLDYDWAKPVQQTSDGGFIVAGGTSSFGAGDSDFWVLRLDANGDIVWQKTYGGPSTDYAYSVQQTSDEGFIVGGITSSYGAGGYDIWVLKLDANGDIVWQKTYGGLRGDGANLLKNTSDGGFIVAGYTYSFGAGDYSDFWILKIDANGNVIWQKTYGGSYGDVANSVQQTSEGGFIVAGGTRLGFGGVDSDFWVLKLDANGNISNCELMEDSFAVIHDTSTTPLISTISPVITSASPKESSVVPLDTDCTIEQQCFAIVQTITVTFPNGSEELSAGTTHEITWSSEGDIDSVKIEYSVNNGADWTEIVASTENDGSYDWEVPCSLSDESLVRISDVDTDVSDESDGGFSIIDGSPPSVTALVDKDYLWPPNHKMVDVGFDYSVTDNCDAEPDISIEVTSDEPTATALGTGGSKHAPDAKINDIVLLRAERSGDNDGRVYQIVVTATDESGNSVSEAVNVKVNKSKKKEAIDSGQFYDATEIN